MFCSVFYLARSLVQLKFLPILLFLFLNSSARRSPRSEEPWSNTRIRPNCYFGNWTMNLQDRWPSPSICTSSSKCMPATGKSQTPCGQSVTNLVSLSDPPKSPTSYVISNDVCYLVLTEKNFSKRLAFNYLEDIQNEFIKQYGPKINLATRPYNFIEFGAFDFVDFFPFTSSSFINPIPTNSATRQTACEINKIDAQ